MSSNKEKHDKNIGVSNRQKLPIVAIIGRPNVGKSTIFNRFVGKRLAIVDEMEGVTRDRIYGETEWEGNAYRVVDCGGIARESADPLHEVVSDNALQALKESDLVLFIVDARAGVTEADDVVKREIWKADKPTILVLNKVDTIRLEDELYEFFSLGFEDIVHISAISGRYFHNLLDLINVKLGYVPQDFSKMSRAEKRLLKERNINEYHKIVSNIEDDFVDDEESRLDKLNESAIIEPLADLNDDACELGDYDKSELITDEIDITDDDIVPDWGDEELDRKFSRKAGAKSMLVSNGHGGFALDGDVSLLDYIDRYHNVNTNGDNDSDDLTRTSCSSDQELTNTSIRIALLGRQNVGKSSIANAFVKDYRVIVSSLPGTTRDPILLEFEAIGRGFTVLDTAGLKKLSKVKDAVDFYAMVRTSKQLPDTDVSILIVDAMEGIFEMDKLVAKRIGEAGKAVVVCVNKWDLVEDSVEMREDYKKYVKQHFTKLRWAQIIFISALEVKGINDLLEAVVNAWNMYNKRVSQNALREVLFEEIALHPPPVIKNNPLKFYDVRQICARPPTFKLWINLKKSVHFSYRGFIENTIRDHFGFEGTFINLIFEEKGRKSRSK